MLEQSQRGSLEITPWLAWFLDTLINALVRSLERMQRVVVKARFWRIYRDCALNKRQVKVVNKMLEVGPDGFDGGLNARKYKSMARISKATATRDLVDLQEKGVIAKIEGHMGRSTRYELLFQDWAFPVEDILPMWHFANPPTGRITA